MVRYCFVLVKLEGRIGVEPYCYFCVESPYSRREPNVAICLWFFGLGIGVRYSDHGSHPYSIDQCTFILIFGRFVMVLCELALEAKASADGAFSLLRYNLDDGYFAAAFTLDGIRRRDDSH